MTFSQSVRTCLSKFATFQGRATRSEYWWFVLFCSVVGGVLIGLATALAIPELRETGDISGGGLFFLVLAGLFGLAMLLPLWAVAVRRFHDRDLSGWLYLAIALLGMVPYVGFLISLVGLVITVLPTKPGGNRYGPDPFQSGAEVF